MTTGERYQLGYYDPGPETWRFYRSSLEEVVEFTSLDEANKMAEEISKSAVLIGNSVIVMTIHTRFRTTVDYPKPEPIYTTTLTKGLNGSGESGGA